MPEDKDERKLLVRVDERTLHIMVTIKQLSDLIQQNYVTKQEFTPVRTIVYGIIGFVTVAFLGGVASLVLIKSGK